MKDPHKNAHESYFNDSGKQKGDSANEAVKFGGRKAKAVSPIPAVSMPNEMQNSKSTDGKKSDPTKYDVGMK